ADEGGVLALAERAGERHADRGAVLLRRLAEAPQELARRSVSTHPRERHRGGLADRYVVLVEGGEQDAVALLSADREHAERFQRGATEGHRLLLRQRSQEGCRARRARLAEEARQS